VLSTYQSNRVNNPALDNTQNDRDSSNNKKNKNEHYSTPARNLHFCRYSFASSSSSPITMCTIYHSLSSSLKAQNLLHKSFPPWTPGILRTAFQGFLFEPVLLFDGRFSVTSFSFFFCYIWETKLVSCQLLSERTKNGHRSYRCISLTVRDD